MPINAILALEDGRCFEGYAFGATGTTTGEICFNTSMSGYQEVITDPSYRGQIVSMTYPQIGNYGINHEDGESSEPHIRGFVIEELCEVPSNWRSAQPLSAYLAEHNVLGIEGIDTRALTKHLRSRGAMRACLTTELDREAAFAAAQASPSMEGADYVKEVSTAASYKWDQESREWKLPNASAENTSGYHELPPVRHRIVAYDFGIKYNILRRLRQAGFEVEVVNSNATAAEVLAKDPDGIFLSNGPGDPAAVGYAVSTIRDLLGKKPLFGICLGHQLLALAVGGMTYKLKFGHRGLNQPVKDLQTGRVEITLQNHGFCVDIGSLGSRARSTHTHLNDGTSEGLSVPDANAFSVQYHPEASAGPHDARYLFKRFTDMLG